MTYRVLIRGISVVGATHAECLRNFMAQTKDLSTIEAEHGDLRTIDFRGYTFDSNQFYSCDFSDCNFQGCDLRQVYFDDCFFTCTDFRRAILPKSTRQEIERNWPSAIFGPPVDGNQLLLEF